MLNKTHQVHNFYKKVTLEQLFSIIKKTETFIVKIKEIFGYSLGGNMETMPSFGLAQQFRIGNNQPVFCNFEA